MEWTFPVTAPLLADLELASGSVSVSLAPTDEVRVSLEPVGQMTDRALEQIQATRVTCNDRQLVVSVPKRKLRETPLRLEVLVPPQSRIECSTASADVACEGTAGAISIKTASGDVRMNGTCDSAEVTTASGDIRMTEVLGEARLKSASGDVWIDSVGGRAAADSASGDVTIGVADSNVRVRTASGDVRISEARRGEVSVNCASGDVEVGVAQGVGAWLDVITVSGSTKCTLPPENSGEADAALRITCRTVSGDVLIEPADVPGSRSAGWSWG